MEFRPIKLPASIDPKIAGYFTYFQLGVFNNKYLVFYKTKELTESFTPFHVKERIEEFFSEVKELNSLEIHQCYHIPYQYDFNMGIIRYIEQLSSLDTVIKSGKILTMIDYNRIRDHRNLLRDYHDYSHGYLTSVAHKAQVKELDTFLAQYELTNPEAQDNYQPVFR